MSEVESSSTWSTADISTDSSSERDPPNAPAQEAESSSENDLVPERQVPAPKARVHLGVRPKPRPKPQPKPVVRPKQKAKAKAKAKARQHPRALDKLALLRRVQLQRRAAQEAEREQRRQARCSELLTGEKELYAGVLICLHAHSFTHTGGCCRPE